MHVCVSVVLYEYMPQVCEFTQRPEKGVGSLELELWVVVNSPMLVLGTELGSS